MYFMLFMIVGVLVLEINNLVVFFESVFLVCLMLNLLLVLLGFGFVKFLNLVFKDLFMLVIEIGV